MRPLLSEDSNGPYTIFTFAPDPSGRTASPDKEVAILVSHAVAEKHRMTPLQYAYWRLPHSPEHKQELKANYERYKAAKASNTLDEYWKEIEAPCSQ